MTAIQRSEHGESVDGTAPQKEPHTFIDLFAGIGGTRLGFERAGLKCVFTSEWNKFSQQTYRANFGSGHDIHGDITLVDASSIPDHDVLIGGFPCQPFSLAGVSKKNSLGRAHGFADPTQGTLFFDIKRILEEKQPQAFMLENVKNLVSHDKGNTFRVIRETLENELGYNLFWRVIDAAAFVPQHRERILLVGFKDDTDFTWDDLRFPATSPKLQSILHKRGGDEPLIDGDGDAYYSHRRKRVQPKYTLTPGLWKYLKDYAAKHAAAGNGFGYGLADVDGVSRTLSARYHKDGSEILIPQRPRPRRLTPRECARLMGFPDTFAIPVSDTQAYRQFGNSVAVPVISEVARIMAPHLK